MFIFHLFKFYIFILEGSTVNDSLHPHMGLSFNTWDKNDCASSDRMNIGGGWWYMSKKSCSFASNLNGVYRGDGRGKFQWGFLVPDEPELTTPQTSEMKINESTIVECVSANSSEGKMR